MKHLDEHSLELYILGSSKLGRKRLRVEAHLEKCAECRRRAKTIREFYASVEREVTRGVAQQANLSGAIIPQTRPAIVRRDNDVSLRPPRRAKIPAIVYPFIRRYPVATGIGAMVFIGAFAWILSLVVGSITKDTNPAYAHYDTSGGVLAVYNKQDEKLWQKPALRLDRIVEAEETKEIRFTLLADLGNGGKKDVVTIVQIGGLDDDGILNRLKIFDPEGDLLALRSLGHQVSFAGKMYAADYGPSGLISWVDTTSQRTQILANAIGFRSPSVLTRIDANGNVLGEYWHYGHLGGIYNVSLLFPTPGNYVALAGINDAEDSVDVSFPAIAILDPMKLRSISESSGSRGFGFAQTPAELVYIRLPETDVHRAIGGKSGVRALKANADQLLAFLVDQKHGIPGIEFVFSRDLALQEVKPMDGFGVLHDTLLKKGKIHSVFNRAYLDSLKNGVQYWDGRQWRKEAVMIHP